MESIFKTDYEHIEFRDKLNDLIEYQQDDNLSNHLQNIFSRRLNQTSGKITNNDFVIWRYSYIWSDMFYSVINGRIIKNENSCFILIKSKLNIFGIGLIVMISILLGYVILTDIVIQNDNSFRFIIWRILIGLILFLLMLIVPIFAYFDSKTRIMKILTENLKLTRKAQ